MALGKVAEKKPSIVDVSLDAIVANFKRLPSAQREIP